MRPQENTEEHRRAQSPVLSILEKALIFIPLVKTIFLLKDE
jgi:hypothetical protein